MKRFVLWAVLAVPLAAGPMGCSKKEIESLNAKVAQMQTELDGARGDLARKSKEAEDAGNQVRQLHAELDAQAVELAKIRAERDTLKSRLAAPKKKKKG